MRSHQQKSHKNHIKSIYFLFYDTDQNYCMTLVRMKVTTNEINAFSHGFNQNLLANLYVKQVIIFFMCFFI